MDAGAGTIWTRRVRGARGPQPEHSRDAIAAAAIALADRQGLAGTTMRSVAAALATSGPTLYRYLSSRDDLLDLMLDAVLAELALDPGTGDWLDDLTGLAERLLALHHRHPWLTALDLPGRALGPSGLDYFDHCLRLLAPVAVGTRTKMEAIALLTGVVALFATSGARAGARSLTPAQLFAAATPERHPHLLAAFAAAAAGPAPDEPADLFRRTVRGVLSGLLTPDPTPPSV